MKKDVVFVVVQFILFALYFIDYTITDYVVVLPEWAETGMLVLSLTGGLIILLGIVNLNENLSPFPSPRKDSSLISNGIYGYVRHPIYSGILLAMFAFGAYSGSVGRLIIAGMLLLLFYFKSELEEKLLIERFPKYSSYKKTTGRFIPKRRSNSES